MEASAETRPALLLPPEGDAQQPSLKLCYPIMRSVEKFDVEMSSSKRELRYAVLPI